MLRFRRTRKILPALLALSVCFGALLAALPHDHGHYRAIARANAVRAATAGVSFDTVEAKHAEHQCLACAVRGMTLHVCEVDSWQDACIADWIGDVEATPIIALPRRFSRPLRGPPVVI